jgi:outer membrane lipoprotein-sorting protein
MVSRFMIIAVMTLVPILSAAAPITAKEIVRRFDQQMRGRTSTGEMSMTIVTPEWKRTMRMRFWESADDDKSFVRVLSPAKDRGTSSLKLGNNMWTYLPAIERSMKIPPSMMQQGWMGSDFTNDDLVKSSSIVDDYVHAITDTVTIDGMKAYVITLDPKEEAAVVWGRIVVYARDGDYLPLREEFYDEDSVLVRKMDFTGFQKMGGRIVPTVMTLVPLTEDKKGHMTTMRYHSLRFNTKIRKSVFTRANLERAR